MRNHRRLVAQYLAARQGLVGEAASEDQIRSAESRLRCRFAEDYREFLRDYGCAMVGAYPIYGIGAKAIDAFAADDEVVARTEQYRKDEWPGLGNSYVVSTDGRGNPICAASDGKIRLLDHDVGDMPVLAESFTEFLVQCVEAAL